MLKSKNYPSALMLTSKMRGNTVTSKMEGSGFKKDVQKK